MSRAPTLLPVEHPLAGKWACGECEAPIGSGFACPDCHTVLCEACAERGVHTVPAGYRDGQVFDPSRPCLPSPQDLPIATPPTGESAAA
ncbi:MAG TPA: hypothetical protein VER11_34610 [Polyangiaceae bacterium]|nr:hypothetical protein [Polyangiaceae bacterium]